MGRICSVLGVNLTRLQNSYFYNYLAKSTWIVLQSGCEETIICEAKESKNHQQNGDD